MTLFVSKNCRLIFLLFAAIICGGTTAAPVSSSSSSDDSTQMLERAQADFALDLLRELSFSNSNSTSKSTVVSPLSVLFPLAMVYAGARGETAEEFRKLLAGKEGKSNESQIHAYFGELLRTIKNNSESSWHTLLAMLKAIIWGERQTLLTMANKVFVKSGFPLGDTFRATLDQNYGGTGENNIETVDFAKSEETAKKINAFVEKATSDKIHDLITPYMLDSMTRLVLVNAVYFNGRWADPFNPKSTHKAQFHVSEHKHTEVDMMQKDDDFIYFFNGELQLLGLPYVGKKMFMFILLPHKRFGLNEMLANLSGEKLLELFQYRYKFEIEVSLPKFRLEATHDLIEPLKKLGLSTAFNSRRADFSGISPAGEQLFISEVLQKAFIEVDEQGTEAAAGTAVEVQFVSAPPSFNANHPFAFFLVAAATGGNGSEKQLQNMILFSGVYRGD